MCCGVTVTSALRSSGIAPIGDIAWGTHLCCFFRTTEDLLALLVPYFKAGLESDEYCMWVVSGRVTKDRQRVIRAWLERLRRAQGQGVAGMRVAGGADWLQSRRKWKDFVEYETVLNRALRDRQMIALCSYDLSASRAADLLDVANAHQFALARRAGTWQAVAWTELAGLAERYATLSPRERQVLRLVAGAHRNKEIADRLAISVKTVEVHRANVMRKLSVRNHIALLRYGLQFALSSPEHQPH
jgi:DNA-binding CsgD family transcriptional regulator